MNIQDIAIIGYSAQFPKSDSLEAFSDLLTKGENAIRSIDARRLRSATLTDKLSYVNAGYLDDIVHFDPAFFDITLGEAEEIAPHQRLLLQQAYRTFEGAHYRLSDLRGSNTSVYVGDAPNEYFHLAKQATPTLIAGNMKSMNAGRIARFFDLRGAAMSIDTACSSTLTALSIACKDLTLEETDMALVCGVNLQVLPPRQGMNGNLGIDSPTGKCSPFSAQANGTLDGEIAACILLKTLDKAIKDGDEIHAVIRGMALNQDAALSSSIMAPSSDAQTAVIQKALDNAGVSAREVGFIEAHGTGTKLGDPIEIAGMAGVFGEALEGEERVYVSAIKSNIGHTDSAAGLAGLIKVLLSFKTNTLFPSVNALPRSEFIDFDAAKVEVLAKAKSWDEVKRTPRRIAGISSFGLMGTNAHVILEAYQSTTEDGVESQKEGAATFCLSAKSAQSLQAYVSAFKDQLAHQSDGLPALAASLHCHREVFPHRFILTANDRSELQEKLQEFSDRPVPTPLSSDSVFLLFDDAGEMGAKELQQLTQHFPALQIDPEEATSGPRISLLLQYQAYQLLTQSATAYLDMIGLGSGRLLIKVLKKELTLQEALAQVDDLPRDATDLAGMKSRAAKLIDRYDKPIHFISLGFKGTMGTAFEQMASQERCGWNIFGGYGQDSLDKSLQTLFLLDREIDPAVLYKHQSIQKLTLPSYEFDRVRCWLRKEGDVFSFGMEEGAAPVAAIDDAGKDLPVQDNILRLFEDVLKMEVKLDDDFFDIGGHSLNGQRLLNRINETYATEFDIDALYDYGTPLAMSDYIRSFQREKEGDSLSDVQPSTEPIKATAQSQLDIPAAPQSDGYLLSGAQYRMWILSQFEEGSLAYNLPNVMELKGAFDKDKLQQAISLVVERHEALRTVFRMDEEGEVRQFILSPDEMTVTLDHRDFRSKNDPDAAVEAYAAMDNQQVFNLEDGPLFRVALLQLRDDHTVFYFNLHHIIADGWSLGILTRDVMAQYESLLSGRAVALPALDIQYKDYAHWQAGLLKDGHSKSHRDFWMEKLGGELPQLNLPSQKKRPPVRTYNAQKLETYLSTVQSQQLYAFSKEQRGSLFITLLALWNVLLHRYTNQNDIIIGSPIAGRDHASLENQIGCYINSLALRNEIQEEETFLSFYQTIRKETLATYAHQMYPFDQLVEDLGGARDLSRNPVFDVMLVLQNTGERISEDHLSASDKAAMTEEVRASEPTFSRFDLEIAFTEVGDQLLLVIHYNTDVYEKAMVEGLIAHFRSLTHQLLSQPGQAVGKVDFLSKAEKEQQLETFNQPSLLPDGVPATVVEAFQKCVAQNPDAIALLTMDRSYTYGEMHRLSNQLADFLQRHEKVTKGDLVALQLPRNEWMVIGLLAILKSGSGYIPFDMDYSPARLQQVAEDSQYQCHLGVELLETFQQTQDQYSEEDISMELQADDLAHVIYTSGSTGKPKGVLIPHRGVVRMSRLKNLPLHAKTRLLQLSSISFDAATFEIWCLILNGGSLVLYPEAKADLETINETVRQKGINTLFLTTALFNQWVHSDISDLPLEYVLTGGEVANPSSAVRLYESHASVKLINCYGPSENTSFTTCFEVPRHWSAEDNIPIGQPIAGTEVYILNAASQLCPIGVTGELCTSGLGLALGYLNREDLSAEKFIDHPFHSGQKLYRTGDMAHWLPNGHIGFVGRDDGQVKIRGFRIELGEVEHQLRQLDALQSVVLRIWEDASGEKDMVAYFVSDQAQDASQLREFLLERLPAYMIPAYFVQLDAMPLNLNGKVDRSKLPSPEETALAGSNTYVAPQNDVEATLVRLWSEVLRQKQIGTQDPFFVIGGNSIKAIKVLSKIKQTFELSVKIDKFFEYDTIEAMAAHINFVLKQQELSKNRSQLKELEL